MPLWQPLLLLLVANGSPILVRLLFAGRVLVPLDGGRRFIDGRPLLGPTKSWHGLLASLLLTSLCSVLLGYAWWLGGLFGLLAMLGDALSSFAKRRLAIAPQGRAVGLDQIPESLLPLWVLHGYFSLNSGQVMLLVVLFALVEVLLSPLLYRWHIRLRPY